MRIRTIDAKDTTSIIAVGGAIAFGGKAGIGAGIAYNRIDGGAEAVLNGTDVNISGAVTVTATNSSKITSVAAAIAASYSSPSLQKGNALGTGSSSYALAAGISINAVTTDTIAKLVNSGTDSDPLQAGTVTVSATDTESRIIGFGGGLAIGL